MCYRQNNRQRRRGRHFRGAMGMSIFVECRDLDPKISRKVTCGAAAGPEPNDRR